MREAPCTHVAQAGPSRRPRSYAMRFMINLCAGIALLAPATAWAETVRCPHTSNDSCNEWRFEQLDRELAELVAGPNEWIDSMPAQLRDDARAALTEAQTQWIKFRDAECRRKLSWSYMTAMTKRGFLAGCLFSLTSARRDNLQKLYKFRLR